MCMRARTSHPNSRRTNGETAVYVNKAFTISAVHTINVAAATARVPSCKRRVARNGCSVCAHIPIIPLSELFSIISTIYTSVSVWLCVGPSTPHECAFGRCSIDSLRPIYYTTLCEEKGIYTYHLTFDKITFSFASIRVAIVLSGCSWVCVCASVAEILLLNRNRNRRSVPQARETIFRKNRTKNAEKFEMQSKTITNASLPERSLVYAFEWIFMWGIRV